MDNFELKIFNKKMNKKGKHATDIKDTYALSIKIICSPRKSREIIPLS